MVDVVAEAVVVVVYKDVAVIGDGVMMLVALLLLPLLEVYDSRMANDYVSDGDRVGYST